MHAGIDSYIAFTFAATLLTITPGLDTALILRTAASDGSRRAFMAALGIQVGCFMWGLIVAVGLGALLLTSPLAYKMLQWAGALYLFYLGGKFLLSPRREFTVGQGSQSAASGIKWLIRGFLTNILNPKVGVFYISFLPQFIPNDADVATTTILLTGIHVLVGIAWSLSLILATRPLSKFLRRSGFIMWLDRITGIAFVGFGVRLAVGNHR